MKIHLYRPDGDASPFNPIHFPLPDGEGDDSGGGGENDDDADDADDGNEEEDEKDDDEPPAKTYTQKDIDKLNRALRAARRERDTYKKAANGNKSGGGDGETGGNGEGQKGPDFRTVAATTTVFAALQRDGFTGNQRKAIRILRDLDIDLSSIEPDSRGFFDPDDFADILDEIKEDSPELFAKPKGRTRSARDEDDDEDEDERPVRRRVSSNASARGSGPGKKLTPDQKFAAAVLGQAGFEDRARTVRRTGR